MDAVGRRWCRRTCRCPGRCGCRCCGEADYAYAHVHVRPETLAVGSNARVPRKKLLEGQVVERSDFVAALVCLYKVPLVAVSDHAARLRG